MRKRKQCTIRTQAQHDDCIVIKNEQVGAQFKVTCSHGELFIVEVVDPTKETVRVTHQKESDLWPKYVVEGQVLGSRNAPGPLMQYSKLPTPEHTVVVPLVEHIERVH